MAEGMPMGPDGAAPAAAGAVYDGEWDRGSPGLLGVSVRAIDEKSILLRAVYGAPVALQRLKVMYLRLS